MAGGGEELDPDVLRALARMALRWLAASGLVFAVFLLAGLAAGDTKLWPLQLGASALLGLVIVALELRHSPHHRLLRLRTAPPSAAQVKRAERLARLRETLPPLDEARFQEIKAHLLQQLSARTLVLNMAVVRERDPGYRYYAVGLDGRMSGDGGGDLADYDAPAAEIVDRLNADPDVAARLDRLLLMGFEMKFGIYDEPWRRDLQLSVIQNPKAEGKLRAEARAEAGATTLAAARRYEERWQLYFNQNYAKDWQEWRKRAPLAEHP